jgi:Zn-dependent protease with chaperone function
LLLAKHSSANKAVSCSHSRMKSIIPSVKRPCYIRVWYDRVQRLLRAANLKWDGHVEALNSNVLQAFFKASGISSTIMIRHCKWPLKELRTNVWRAKKRSERS